MIMQRNICLCAALLTGMGISTPAWSADPPKVTVLLDNAQVRVLRMTTGRGAHQVQVDSDDHVIIPLNDFNSKETRDGNSEALVRKRGQAYWRQGGPRAYDFTSKADMIIIDLKPGKGTTAK
jgi:hypothetical protein